MEKYAGVDPELVVRLRVMDVLAVFLVALGTALATGLGALPFVFARQPDRTWLGTANSLAAGLMLGASAGLLYEGAGHGVERTALGAVAGGVFIFASQRLIDSHEALHLGSLEGADATKALLIVGIMTIHSFAEGVGVGVAFGVEQSLGILIGARNRRAQHPGGPGDQPRSRPARDVAANGRRMERLLEPSPAPHGGSRVPVRRGVLRIPSIGLGFAAGAMIWLVAADLVPEALEASKPLAVACTVTASAAAMLVFVLLLL